MEKISSAQNKDWRQGSTFVTNAFSRVFKPFYVGQERGHMAIYESQVRFKHWQLLRACPIFVTIKQHDVCMSVHHLF